jgi:hypothetical protein
MSALITGLPGSAKTLYTIDMVKKLSESPEGETRSVYYSGIKDLKLSWIELHDPTLWPDLPPGSIILIDEAQRYFRPRSSTAQVPRHISELETHRHKGFDLFFITQHPSFIDAAIRKTFDHHFHLVRKFNLHWSTVYEFYEVREQPEKFRVGAIETQFRFPTELFGVYKSADLHTKKVRIPLKVKMLMLSPVVMLIVMAFIYRWYNQRLDHELKGGPDAKNSAVVAKGGISTVTTVPVRSESAAAKGQEFLSSMVAVVPGLAYTAVAYQELTKPSYVPAPVACVASEDRCLCYTDQGTRLSDVSESFCRGAVENGFFVSWEKKENSRGAGLPERQRTAAPAPAVGVGAGAGIGTIPSAAVIAPAEPARQAVVPPSRGAASVQVPPLPTAPGSSISIAR